MNNNELNKNCHTGNKLEYLEKIDGRLNDVMFLLDKALYLAYELNEKAETIGFDTNEQALSRSKENLGIHSDILCDYLQRVDEALKNLEHDVFGDFLKEKKRLEERRNEQNDRAKAEEENHK